jgi:Putative beta-barrel porin-2, OmpL-like. bbp2
MNLNKWTVTLAAAGIVTLPSLLQAQDQTPNSVLTALSATTLSGYVDTSAQWNFGTGNANLPPYGFGGGSKADGFNLDVVDLALDKPLDDSLWAAGYHVELWMGPDANALATQSSGVGGDFAIRQAYVALRTPIGNGITWKVGVWDTIIGYEGLTSYNNPNYTHSYGFSIEPTTHTGVLGTYQVSDAVSLSAGIANTFGPTINGRDPGSESYKTYMASIALTAPTNWAWLSGSTLNAGVINGFDAAGAPAGAKQTSAYLGTTLATPITGVKLGASLDYLEMHDARAVYGADGTAWAAALYATVQATEKLGLNFRGEWVDDHADFLQPDGLPISAVPAGTTGAAGGFRAIAFTATAQYSLWQNVLSRVEFRWDHAESASLFGGTIPGQPTLRNVFMLAANIVYEF